MDDTAQFGELFWRALLAAYCFWVARGSESSCDDAKGLGANGSLGDVRDMNNTRASIRSENDQSVSETLGRSLVDLTGTMCDRCCAIKGMCSGDSRRRQTYARWQSHALEWQTADVEQVSGTLLSAWRWVCESAWPRGRRRGGPGRRGERYHIRLLTSPGS